MNISSELQESVLVVDDDEIARETHASKIEQAGFTALRAACAAEGLEIMKKNTIFLVISDFEMPGMDGVEFCQQVKRENRDIPFVIISAYSDLAKASMKASQFGVDDLLDKPCSKEEISSIVKRFAKKRLESLERELGQDSEFTI